MLALALTHVHWQPILPRDVLASKFEYAPHAAGYSRVLMGDDPRSDSRYSLTQRGCAHRGIPHSLSCFLVQTIGSSMMYFRVFIEIFEFQMYTLGHAPY